MATSVSLADPREGYHFEAYMGSSSEPTAFSGVSFPLFDNTAKPSESPKVIGTLDVPTLRSLTGYQASMDVCVPEKAFGDGTGLQNVVYGESSMAGTRYPISTAASLVLYKDADKYKALVGISNNISQQPGDASVQGMDFVTSMAQSAPPTATFIHQNASQGMCGDVVEGSAGTAACSTEKDYTCCSVVGLK